MNALASRRGQDALGLGCTAHQQLHATMHLPRAALRAPQQPAGHDVLQSESHAALQVLLQAMMRAAMGTRGA